MSGSICAQPGTLPLTTPPGQVAGSARSSALFWLSVTPLKSLLNSGTLKPVL